MKSSRWIIPAVVAVGLLAGAAIVGRPTPTSQLRLPLEIATTSTTVAPTTTAAPVSSETPPDTSAALVNTTTTADTTSTVADGRSAVRVVVGNGTTENGLATAIATELIDLGFTDSKAANALGDADIPDSFVIYREGFEADAIDLAQELGIPLERVLPLLPGAEFTDADDGGDVIVVIGNDRVG